MAGRVRVREISDDEGNRLKRIVRRGTGSVVRWRRALMVLWPSQGMSAAQIARPAFTSEDRVRDVLRNFSAESLYPRHAGGRPPAFTLAQRREIKKIARSAPAGHGLPSATAAGNPAAAGGNQPGSTVTPEAVDWGRSGPNEMITLNALRVLKTAGRLTSPAYEPKPG